MKKTAQAKSEKQTSNITEVVDFKKPSVDMTVVNEKNGVDVKSLLVFHIIAGPKMQTKLMQAADMFESFKVVGEPFKVSATSTKTDFTQDNIDEVISGLREILKKEMGYIVSLIHLVSIKRKNMIEINENTYKPYINKKVKVISNGQYWVMFSDILKFYKIEFKTDENMNIL